MPAASSSRRRNNGRSRVLASDDIEEDQHSQHENEDDDVDEDENEEQPSRSARVKKEKLSRSRRSQHVESAGDEDEDEDEVDENRIDIANFKDQPLSKDDSGPKINGIIKDWEMIRKQSQHSVKGLMDSIGVSMADLMQPEEAKKALAELDIVMKDILDIEEEMILNEDSVNDLYQQLHTGVPVEGAVEKYEKGVKKRLNDYRAKTARQKYAKKDPYRTFREAIHEAQHPGEGIPPITELIPKEDGDVSDDDDELEVGGVTQDYRCPLSLTTLKNPLTSRLCQHSFSEKAIRDFLGPNRMAKKRCPASGCTKEICLGDLELNKLLERRVKAAERRIRRQEDDSGDDEVIE